MCSQTAHSKKEVARYYPQVNQTMIWKLYGGCGPLCKMSDRHKWNQKQENWRYKSDQLERQIAEDSAAWSELNKINLTEFMIKTRPLIQIWDCKLGHLNCKYSWKHVQTYLGQCRELRPSTVQEGKIQLD